MCLHFTAGTIRGDMPTLTGDSGTISVPFLISHAGIIYQLLDPDKELSWHLGSNLGYWYHHNQIIGIELRNAGHEVIL